MDGKTCIEKQKTVTARRTLDPLYQQQLCFSERYNNRILQVGVKLTNALMFPLRCACAQVMRREHTRKLGAHINASSKNVFAHISYTSFYVQIYSGIMLHKRDFMRTQTLKN